MSFRRFALLPCAVGALFLGHAHAALAWSCVAAATPAMTTTPGCLHGAPARSGDLLLVPRICRTTLQGKTFDRHTVDIRNGATGARVGQASLPPIEPKPGAPLGEVGQVLGGALPLLVYAGGIGAIDAKASRIELVFESETGLNAVARAGEVLALAEKMAPDKQFPKGGVEWTVLDYGSGEILGQLQLAGPPAEAVELRATSGAGMEATLYRSAGGKRMALVAQVRDAAGKATGAAMKAKVTEVPVVSRVPMVAGCALLAAADAVRADVAGLAVSEEAARNVAAPAPSGRAKVADPAACVAILQPDARGETFGWFTAAKGKAELRAARCQTP